MLVRRYFGRLYCDWPSYQESEKYLMSTRLKVGFVSVLSCLALMLGLFASTGIASAHSAQATDSQVSASTSVSTSANARCFGGFEEECFGFGFGNRFGFGHRFGFGNRFGFCHRLFFRHRFFRRRFFFRLA